MTTPLARLSHLCCLFSRHTTPRKIRYPLLAALALLGVAGLVFVLGPLLSRSAIAAGGAACTLALIPLGFHLGRLHDRLEHLSFTDPCTHLWNRRFLDGRLVREVRRSRLVRAPLAVLFIDLDDLKVINKRGGHKAGDRALRALAESIRRAIRPTDVAARVGGDEFVVLAPDTEPREALALATRIQEALLKLGCPLGPLPALSVSIGIADVDTVGADACALLHAADAAMSVAQAQGGNRLSVAGAPPSGTRVPRPVARAPRATPRAYAPAFVTVPVQDIWDAVRSRG